MGGWSWLRNSESEMGWSGIVVREVAAVLGHDIALPLAPRKFEDVLAFSFALETRRPLVAMVRVSFSCDTAVLVRWRMTFDSAPGEGSPIGSVVPYPANEGKLETAKFLAQTPVLTRGDHTVRVQVGARAPAVLNVRPHATTREGLYLALFELR